MDEKSDGSVPVDIKKADSPPRLLTLVHEAIRRKYYSRRTEEAYVHWIKRFIYFHGKRHPRDMGEAEVTAFLNDLASVRNVAGGTQNQALSALLFLYKEVLGKDLAWLDGLVRAKRPPRLPTVLTQAEAEALLAQLTGVRWLVVSLLYGAGLRVMECRCWCAMARRCRASTRAPGASGSADPDDGVMRRHQPARSHRAQWPPVKSVSRRLQARALVTLRLVPPRRKAG